jgi:hypothetical protein
VCVVQWWVVSVCVCVCVCKVVVVSGWVVVTMVVMNTLQQLCKVVSVTSTSDSYYR